MMPGVFRRSSSVVSAAVLIGALLAPRIASAQAGSGKKYDTRDPRTCPSKVAPAKGAITLAAATQYVICSEEHEFSGSMILVDNMKIQIGGSRKYIKNDESKWNIDPTQLVYPIRGSYVRIRCDPPKATPAGGGWPAMSNIGKNCFVYDQPNAEGACFKTTFGDWDCTMKDLGNTLTIIRKDVPPPR